MKIQSSTRVEYSVMYTEMFEDHYPYYVDVVFDEDEEGEWFTAWMCNGGIPFKINMGRTRKEDFEKEFASYMDGKLGKYMELLHAKHLLLEGTEDPDPETYVYFPTGNDKFQEAARKLLHLDNPDFVIEIEKEQRGAAVYFSAWLWEKGNRYKALLFGRDTETCSEEQFEKEVLARLDENIERYRKYCPKE